MIKQIPIYVHNEDGTRKAVGIIEIQDGNITGRLVDRELAERIGRLHNGAFSLSPEPVNGRQ